MIQKMAHTSFTVSDLKASIQFFVDGLGLKATPIIEVENEVIQTVIGMPGASLLISNVTLPDESVIELIQYVQPKGHNLDLSTQNIGVAHIAFYVSDIKSMHKSLSEQGVTFVNPPIWDEVLGMTICYLRGPDGITFELMEKSNGES